MGLLFWIAGDEAYCVSQWIIVPYPSSTLTEDEDNFNSYPSSLRIHIEQAFGMLVARWRILCNGLNFSVKRCTTVISVVMKLHNFCLQEDRMGGRVLRGWDGVIDCLLP